MREQVDKFNCQKLVSNCFSILVKWNVMPLLGLLEGHFCFSLNVCAILSPVAGRSEARDNIRVTKGHTQQQILTHYVD